MEEITGSAKTCSWIRLNQFNSRWNGNSENDNLDTQTTISNHLEMEHTTYIEESWWAIGEDYCTERRVDVKMISRLTNLQDDQFDWESTAEMIWESIYQTVWRENLFLTTTTATQLGRRLSDDGCTEMQEWWKRTEQQQVIRDWWVAEMDRVMGSIYSADLTVDSLYNVILYLISSHLIIQGITHSIFFIFWSHSLFPRESVDPDNCVDPHSRVVSYLVTTFLCATSQNSSFSRIHLECCERCGGLLMLNCLPSRSAVSPQMEPKRGFRFWKLSSVGWERPLRPNTGKYWKKQLVDDTNNVGLECRMQYTVYIDLAVYTGTTLIPVVLATSPGNQPVVRVCTRQMVQFDSRTVRKPDLVFLGRVVSWTGQKRAGSRPGWNRNAVPFYSSYNFDSTWASIQYLRSDHIMTWLIRRSCTVRRCFTCRFQNFDLTNIHWIPGEWPKISGEIYGVSIATQQILVRSLIWKQEAKDRLKLHNPHIDHVTIQSELKYSIGAKVVRLKCQVFGGKTGPIAPVRVFVWWNQLQWSGSRLEPDLQPNQTIGSTANTKFHDERRGNEAKLTLDEGNRANTRMNT